MVKSVKIPNIISTINWAVEELEKHHNPLAQKEVELILSSLLKCQSIDLYLQKDKIMPEDVFIRFLDIVKKRSNQLPLQYLLETTDFYGLKLKVKTGVFIPRPETEVLVEKVIDLIRKKIKKPVRILELCTGSGNISVALTKNIQYCTIMSSDINPEALALAQDNARIHNVEDRIEFILSDLFSAVSQYKDTKAIFDLIIANPPYISRKQLPYLPPDVGFEPKNALDGGVNGLGFYEKIIAECRPYLKTGGYIAFEFGDDQHRKIEEIINKSLFLENPVFFPDLNGICRCVIARRTCG